MTDIERYRTLAKQYAETLAASPYVQAIWLFGSVHQGRIWAGSDIDLLVLMADFDDIVVSYALIEDVRIHLHQYPAGTIDHAVLLPGDLRFHRLLGNSEVLYDQSGDYEAKAAELRAFPFPYRLYHILPHLEALSRWAQDLHKRMALGDERPRRAQHRQWEVDHHAASILLIEKGIYPGLEPITQALNARLFVPTLADPNEIEQFVLPHVQNWLVPRLQRWRNQQSVVFHAYSLNYQHELPDISCLLELGLRHGILRQVLLDHVPSGIMYQLA